MPCSGQAHNSSSVKKSHSPRRNRSMISRYDPPPPSGPKGIHSLSNASSPRTSISFRSAPLLAPLDLATAPPEARSRHRFATPTTSMQPERYMDSLELKGVSPRERLEKMACTTTCCGRRKKKQGGGEKDTMKKTEEKLGNPFIHKKKWENISSVISLDKV